MTAPKIAAAACVLALALIAAAPVARGQGDEDEDAKLSAEDRALIEESLAGETISVIGEAAIDPSPPGVADVSRQELHVMAGSRGDAIGAVRNLPGIANADAYDGVGVLAIRGTSGEDSIVLVDGIPVPLAMHFGNVTAVLPTAMIESIELQPGGFGAEYGRATGGVLAISTRSRTADVWSGFAELSFINAGGFIEGPISKRENVNLAMSFRRSIIDALLPAFVPEDSTVSFRIPPRYYDGQLRLEWLAPKGHKLTFLTFASDDRVSVRIGGVDPLDPALTGDLAAREGFWRAALAWSYQRDALENNATISVGRDIREQSLGGDRLFYRLKPMTIYLREEASWRARPWARLRAGADLEAISGNIAVSVTLPAGEGAPDPILAGDPLIEYDEETSDRRAAGWLALDLLANRSGPRALTLTPQLRLDHFGRTDSTVVQPRLSASAALSRRITLRAALGRYARPLALAEQLRTDLVPEKATHLVGGVEVGLTEGIRLTASGFATELSDLVVRDPDFMGTDALAAYQNTGTGRVVGVELLLRASRENVSGWLAYTGSRSTRTDIPGGPRRLFDYDQPHNLVAVGSYQVGPWRFGARFRLASGTPETPIIGSVYDSDRNFYRPVRGRQNSQRTDLDHQLDVRLDRQFQLGAARLEAFLDISNAYANPKQLGTDYSFDYREKEPITDVPILPSIGLRGTL